MSDAELEFSADELAMLRQAFRGEAQDALEVMTTRILASGAHPPSAESLAEMLRLTHTLKGAAGTVGLPTMVELSHRLETALIALAGRDGPPWSTALGEQLVEVLDGLRVYLDHAPEPSAAAQADAVRAQLARLAPARATTPAVPADAPADAPVDAPDNATVAAAADAPVDAPVAPADEPAGAAAPRAPAPSPAHILDPASDAVAAEPAAEPKPHLRVDPERVDELMSSAGELLFDRTRIERRVQLLRTLARDLARTRQGVRDRLAEDAELAPDTRAALTGADAELAGHATLLSQTTAGLLEDLEALRRTIGQLQRGLTRIRMESARSLMAHAARTLRALRRATGIAVELRTAGEDTEFDKAVAEQLLDPITQLLRNAIAHGIEPPAERAARGKPAIATILVRARQDGSSLVLEVSDDGRGVDTAALAQRLVRAGHWTAARARLASDADVLAALLDASVSIRDEADELAGRGVGLGVVRQVVAGLGGELTVASTAGRGAAFTLRVPLSTVLGHATLFKVDGQVYAIPHVHVADTTHVAAHATTATVGRATLPVLRLEALLGHGADAERRPALVVSFAGRSLVCTVDKIIGPREVIIKPLGPLLAPLTLYAGATISGSGKVQLILDPAQLVRRAYPHAPLPTPEPGAPAPLAGRALVADDSRAIREALTSMLGSAGWIVDAAEDGARALQLAHQLRYDLVVTDLEMPAVDGFALIVRLRADDRYRDTPIVVLTSRATPEHRRRARELAVAAVIAKPLTRRKLLEAIAARPGATA